MSQRQDREPTVAEALGAWREAERRTIRATAQREASEEAIEAARLAEEAAQATAAASRAAQLAAGRRGKSRRRDGPGRPEGHACQPGGGRGEAGPRAGGAPS